MSSLRNLYLRWRYPEAYRIAMRVRREAVRRQPVRASPWSAADSFRSAMDAAQACIEGGPEESDAAARWLDLLGPSPARLCRHPDAVTEFYRGPAAFRRRHTPAGSWKLVRRACAGYYVRRCPDCPARLAQAAVPGVSVHLELSPWLLPTTYRTPYDCNDAAP